MKVKEAAANEQHSSVIEVLRAVADGWAVENVNFVVGNHRSVMKGNFYENFSGENNPTLGRPHSN